MIGFPEIREDDALLIQRRDIGPELFTGVNASSTDDTGHDLKGLFA